MRLLAVSSSLCLAALAAVVAPFAPIAAAVVAVPRADDDPKVDPRARAIYDAGLAAVAKIKSIELVAESRLDGIDPSLLPPGFGGRFLVRLDFGKATHAMRFEAAPGAAKRGTTLITAGQKSLAFDADAKTYTEGGSDWYRIAGTMTSAAPNWILENRLRAGQANALVSKLVAAELREPVKLDGVECDVVKIVRVLDAGGAGAPMELRFHETIAFARTDALPRRIEMRPELPEGNNAAAAGGPIAYYSAVKVDPAFDASVFAMTPPEGYRKVEVAAPVKPAAATGSELAVKVGDPAPDFKLMTLDGKEVTLASLKGKVVLLDFWATWCGPCKAAMPTIQKISEEYAAKKDGGNSVAVFGVNTWEQKPNAAKDYFAKMKFTYGCLLKGDDLAQAYRMNAIPTLVVIGTDGKVVATEVGMSDPSGSSIRNAIERALAK
jgi:hypothetical protein